MKKQIKNILIKSRLLKNGFENLFLEFNLKVLI